MFQIMYYKASIFLLFDAINMLDWYQLKFYKCEFCIIGIYINPSNYTWTHTRTHARARARAHTHTHRVQFSCDYLCIVLLITFSKKEVDNSYLLKQLQKQN